MMDEQVLQVATRAKNGEKVSRLLAGDSTGYASPSEADLAFVGILACYTPDPEQLARLWQGSGLARRKAHVPGYVRRTIVKAVRNRGFTYDPEYRGER